MRDHRKENRMESFFLAETTKYLYLLFDPDHYLNNDGSIGTVINTPNGECVIDTGGYIFNTEAHPIDPAALRCCHDIPRQQLLSEDYNPADYMGDVFLINMETDTDVADAASVNQTYGEDTNITNEITRLTNLTSFNVDQLFSTDEAKNELLRFLKEIEESSEKKSVTDDAKDETGAQETETNELQQQRHHAENEFNDDLVIPKEIDDEGLGNVFETSSAINGTMPLVSRKEMNQTINPMQIQKPNVEYYNELADEPRISTNATVLNESDNMNAERNRIVPPPPPPPTAMPRKLMEPFDAQRLMQSVRTMYNDRNVTRNYDVLSCRAQSYSQRLAVLGEIIT